MRHKSPQQSIFYDKRHKKKYFYYKLPFDMIYNHLIFLFTSIIPDIPITCCIFFRVQKINSIYPEEWCLILYSDCLTGALPLNLSPKYQKSLPDSMHLLHSRFHSPPFECDAQHSCYFETDFAPLAPITIIGNSFHHYDSWCCNEFLL